MKNPDNNIPKKYPNKLINADTPKDRTKSVRKQKFLSFRT